MDKEKILYFNHGEYETSLPCLQMEDEQRLIEKLSYEDNSEAKQKLIEGNLRLILDIVRKFNTKEVEDLVSIGIIGLIKGVNTFKLEKKIEFKEYITKCIENEIVKFLEKAKL